MIHVAQARERRDGGGGGGGWGEGPLEEVVDVVADDEGVVFAGEADEGLATGEGHGLAGGVGAGCYDVDDVFVVLSPFFITLDRLVLIVSESQPSSHWKRGFGSSPLPYEDASPPPPTPESSSRALQYQYPPHPQV